MPGKVITEETGVLESLGVEIRLKSDIMQDNFLSGLVAEFDAVFLELDAGKISGAP